MDFNLSEEQEALQEMARDFLRERWPSERSRALLDTRPATIDDDVWSEIVEMGWLGVAASEEAGGIGGDVLTAAVLAQEAGRGVLPGPFQSCLVAAMALDRSGDATHRPLLADLISGAVRVTVAIDEPGGRWGPDSVSTKAEPAGDGFRVSGSKLLVPDAEGAAVLLVAARTASGLALLRIPADTEGVAIHRMERMDAQSCAEVVFENATVDGDALLGGADGSDALVREVYAIWTVLMAADLLGTTEASVELTTRYAQDRVQFGRPIGTFQAVSHRLADSLVELEIGRSLLYGACLALDEGRENATPLISAAKASLSDAAVTATEASLQLHGGVGFTWEYDVHLHLRRARCNAAMLGDADYHRDVVASYMDEAWVPPVKT